MRFYIKNNAENSRKAVEGLEGLIGEQGAPGTPANCPKHDYRKTPAKKTQAQSRRERPFSALAYSTLPSINAPAKPTDNADFFILLIIFSKDILIHYCPVISRINTTVYEIG